MIHRISIIIISGWLGILTESSLTAQFDWMSLGPEGGNIRSLMVNPQNKNTLYAIAGDDPSGVNQGIYKSGNGGLRWMRLNNNRWPLMDDEPIEAALSASNLAIDTIDTNTLYAWSEGLLLQSRDTGLNWSRLKTGFSFNRFFADPQQSRVLYAYSSGAKVFHKSTDSGVSWSSIEAPLQRSLFQLIRSPADTGTLYALSGAFSLPTQPEVLLKSSDDGQNWRETGSVPTVPNSRIVIGVHPQNSAIVYLYNAGTLWKSEDSGNQWTMLSALPESVAGFIETLTIHSNNPDQLYLSGENRTFYQSDDGGISWRDSAIEEFAYGSTTLALDQTTNDTLYLGTHHGIFKSIDNGQRWSAINTGLNKKDSLGVKINPQSPNTLYSYNERGIFKSSDGGIAWRTLRLGLEEYGEFPINDFAIALSAPDSLYLLRLDGLFQSVDGGEQWHRVSSDDNEQEAPNHRLFVDSQDPELLYGIRFIPSAVTPSRDQLLKSTDGGQNWHEAGVGLGVDDFPRVGDLIIHPKDPDIIYAGLITGGFYYSNDGAASWELLNFADDAVRNLALDPNNPSTLYASVSDQGIFKSTDEGLHWSKLSNGLSESVYDAEIIISPSNSATVYALLASAPVIAGARKIIYQSLNGDATWAALNNIGDSGLHHSISVHPQRSDLIYLASESGIYTSLATTGQPVSLATIWWDPAKSGQGLMLLQRDNLLWGEWHHYDENSNDAWLLFQGEIIDQRVDTDLLRFSGPALGAPWDTGLVHDEIVGHIRIELPSPFSMLLSYQIGDSNGTLTIEPFQPNATDPYTGIWWNPATSGQGFALQQQGDTFWGLWNSYDQNGEDQWVVFQGTEINQIVNATLLRFNGPSLATDWDVSRVNGAAAGEVTLQFLAPDKIKFNYILDQVDGELQLIPFR